MEVYFEQTGRKEDRDLIGYMRDLKERGLDFDPQNSESYAPFKAEDFKRLCLGKPFRRTKDNPMIQIADLVLFPMAKAGYQPGYRPYVQLKAAGKLIDCHIAEGALSARGIKYSCFDADKTKAQLGS